MTEIKIGDQVYHQGRNKEVVGFDESAGTRLSDGSTVCRTELERCPLLRHGCSENHWMHKPAKPKREPGTISTDDLVLGLDGKWRKIDGFTGTYHQEHGCEDTRVVLEGGREVSTDHLKPEGTEGRWVERRPEPDLKAVIQDAWSEARTGGLSGPMFGPRAKTIIHNAVEKWHMGIVYRLTGENEKLLSELDDERGKADGLERDANYWKGLADARETAFFELQAKLNEKPGSQPDLGYEARIRDLHSKLDGEIKRRQEAERKVGSLERELQDCKRGHCKAAYDQNEQGGQARQMVANAAIALGIHLGEGKPEGVRDIWDPKNMRRVTERADELRRNLAEILGRGPGSSWDSLIHSAALAVYRAKKVPDLRQEIEDLKGDVEKARGDASRYGVQIEHIFQYLAEKRA